ncbi:MAG: Sir2 family NAD-dependent protein deacetylase [Pseudomonadota bacterium]
MSDSTKTDVQDALERARALLRSSDRVATFSGAGLSAESGLSTFRDPDPDALWSRFDPTELASVKGFEANPERVLEWYRWRRGVHASVEPNAAHYALAAQTEMIQITQNVDHLLEQAGLNPWRVLHLHGSAIHDRCHNEACDHSEQIDPGEPPPDRACPLCGDRMRPAVVWFGESLPEATWTRAYRLCTTLDCLLVVGTSATVYPAAGLIQLARQHGSRVVVVDPAASAAGDAADVWVPGAAGEWLPPLLEGLELVSER